MLWLTGGEAKRAREKPSAAAPSLALGLAMPKAIATKIALDYSPGQSVARVCEYASWWLEVSARSDRAFTEWAAGKEGEAALTRRRWKRRPTPSRREWLLSDELLTSA